jgi:branched-chain amino acid transport system permease protein
MDTLLQQLVNGLSVGAIYALVTAGLALTFGVLGVINFAHGDVLTIGAYIFFIAHGAWGLDYLPATGVTLAGMAVVGVVFARLVIQPVIRRDWQVQLIVTLAASVIIVNGLTWASGGVPRSTTTHLSELNADVLGVRFSYQHFVVIVVAIVTFALMHQFLQRSRMGKAMRAVSQNQDAAEAAGIDIKQIALVTFLVGIVLIGIASVLVAPTATVVPTMGTLLTLKAFAVLVITGFGRVGGAVAAAMGLGVVEALGTQYLSASYTDAYAFVAMVVVLLVLPRGLAGRKVAV